MKIARFDEGRIGVVLGDDLVDVTDVLGIDPGEWPAVGANRLIRDFAQHADAIAEASESEPRVPLSSVTLRTPVPAASKVIAFPVNYHDHGREMQAGYRADVQGFFLKPPSSLSGAGEPVRLPVVPGREVHHESELAVVIGKRCHDIRREDWEEHVFGYACLLDMVVRGREERVFRKAFDTFCPVGPWITTKDEVGDPTDLDMKLWVRHADDSEELRQHANTRDLVLDIPGMVQMAAAVMTLEPGDIIATGTPAGVGPVDAGDTIRISIERLGHMSVPVVQGTSGRTEVFANPYTTDIVKQPLVSEEKARMTAPDRGPDLDSVTSLDQLYGIFEELSMEGGWHRPAGPALWPEPRKTLLPHVWHYAEIKGVLDVAGRLVDHTHADRRNVTLTNPAEGNVYPTVRTMVAAYQMIKPGENALAHHHTPAALRIILEGEGTYTVVEGDRVEMRPGDVLLTPSWTWHEHSAADDADDCYWVDILDVPLVHLLEPMFFEKYPDGLQADPRDVEESPIAFRWTESVARLTAQTEAPADGMAEREIELTDPRGRPGDADHRAARAAVLGRVRLADDAHHRELALHRPGGQRRGARRRRDPALGARRHHRRPRLAAVLLHRPRGRLPGPGQRRAGVRRARPAAHREALRRVR